MSVIQPMASKVTASAWGAVVCSVTMPNTRSEAGILRYLDMRASAQTLAAQLIRTETALRTEPQLRQYRQPTYTESAITFHFTPTKREEGGHDVEFR